MAINSPVNTSTVAHQYTYKMGIKVGSTKIPDVSSWKYQVGDLDTSGRRDAKGMLHRAYVATKINYEFEWKGLDWSMLELIVDAVAKPKFKLTAPDPRSFDEKYTGNYYVGDRTGSCNYFIPERGNIAVFDLKLKFIEY